MKKSLLSLLLLSAATVNAENNSPINGDGTISVCFPKVKAESRRCDNIYVPESLRDLVGQTEIENAYSSITDYGMSITNHVNPKFRKIADLAAEAVVAAGYGPFLALGNFALKNRLNGGAAADPITQMAEVILQRISAAEERIISRLDEQLRQDAIDQFSGMRQLFAIYQTADSMDSRSTSVYRSRLSYVDASLDTLIFNFQNTRFDNKHVANYQAYLELVALRLAVLAESERLSLYEQYGANMDERLPIYKYRLAAQYKIILSQVFDYLNGYLMDSNEWETTSDARFGKPKYDWKHLKQDYSIIRPLLCQEEIDHYDQKGSYRVSGRNAHVVTYTLGERMALQEHSYTFSGVPYNFHSTIQDYKAVAHGVNGTFYYTSQFENNITKVTSCFKTKYNWSCDYKRKVENAFSETLTYHKNRAFYQFVEIYYSPTVEILDKWWEIYSEGASLRPKNRLDIMLEEME